MGTCITYVYCSLGHLQGNYTLILIIIPIVHEYMNMDMKHPPFIKILGEKWLIAQ